MRHCQFNVKKNIIKKMDAVVFVVLVIVFVKTLDAANVKPLDRALESFEVVLGFDKYDPSKNQALISKAQNILEQIKKTNKYTEDIFTLNKNRLNSSITELRPVEIHWEDKLFSYEIKRSRKKKKEIVCDGSPNIRDSKEITSTKRDFNASDSNNIKINTLPQKHTLNKEISYHNSDVKHVENISKDINPHFRAKQQHQLKSEDSFTKPINASESLEAKVIKNSSKDDFTTELEEPIITSGQVMPEISHIGQHSKGGNKTLQSFLPDYKYKFKFNVMLNSAEDKERKTGISDIDSSADNIEPPPKLPDGSLIHSIEQNQKFNLNDSSEYHGNLKNIDNPMQKHLYKINHSNNVKKFTKPIHTIFTITKNEHKSDEMTENSKDTIIDHNNMDELDDIGAPRKTPIPIQASQSNAYNKMFVSGDNGENVKTFLKEKQINGYTAKTGEDLELPASIAFKAKNDGELYKDIEETNDNNNSALFSDVNNDYLTQLSSNLNDSTTGNARSKIVVTESVLKKSAEKSRDNMAEQSAIHQSKVANQAFDNTEITNKPPNELHPFNKANDWDYAYGDFIKIIKRP